MMCPLCKKKDCFYTAENDNGGKIIYCTNCFNSYTGYAYAQIQKAKGQNKKVNKAETWLNQEALEELYYYYQQGCFSEDWLNRRFNSHIVKHLKNKFGDRFSSWDIKACDTFVEKYHHKLYAIMRPTIAQFIHTIGRYDVAISPLRIYDETPTYKICNLDDKDCAAITHLPNCYNVFRNGDGIIKDNQIACSSIAKDRVKKDYAFSVFHNKELYEKSVKEYNQFWEWYCNRNVYRWEKQIGENNTVKLNYDGKNISHTFRLLAEGNHIVKYGEPMIVMKGKLREFLMDIRNAKYTYEYLLDKAQDEMTSMKENFKNSTLPKTVNMQKINNLYQTLMDMGVI